MNSDTPTQSPPPSQVTLRLGDSHSIAGEMDFDVVPGQGSVEITKQVFALLRQAAARQDMRLLEHVTPFSQEPMARAVAIAAAAHIAKLEARIAVLETRLALTQGSGEFSTP